MQHIFAFVYKPQGEGPSWPSRLVSVCVYGPQQFLDTISLFSLTKAYMKASVSLEIELMRIYFQNDHRHTY